MSAEPTSDASRLCLSCAMCCNGVMHPAIEIDRTERERATVEGLQVGGHPDKPMVAQPCPWLHGTSCSHYGDWRPRTCETYLCRLQRRMADGEVTLQEAVAIAEGLRRQVGLLFDRNDFDRSLAAAFNQASVEMNAIAAGEPKPRELAERLIKLSAINRVLDQHFRNSGWIFADR